MPPNDAVDVIIDGGNTHFTEAERRTSPEGSLFETTLFMLIATSDCEEIKCCFQLPFGRFLTKETRIRHRC
jgi:hypothetical protein